MNHHKISVPVADLRVLVDLLNDVGGTLMSPDEVDVVRWIEDQIAIYDEHQEARHGA